MKVRLLKNDVAYPEYGSIPSWTQSTGGSDSDSLSSQDPELTFDNRMDEIGTTDILADLPKSRLRQITVAVGLELVHRAIVLWPKMVSMRQLTQTETPLDWSNTVWATQMVSFTLLGGGSAAVIDAAYFREVRQFLRQVCGINSDLPAALLSIPPSAVTTVPVTYYEQQLQTDSHCSFPTLLSTPLSQVYRSFLSWSLQKGVYNAIFLPVNEYLVDRFNAKDNRLKQAVIGTLLCITVSFIVWPLHWYSAQVSKTDNRDLTGIDIVKEVIDNSALTDIYAGFKIHVLSYLISGLFQGLMHGILRQSDVEIETNNDFIGLNNDNLATREADLEYLPV